MQSGTAAPNSSPGGQRAERRARRGAWPPPRPTVKRKSRTAAQQKKAKTIDFRWSQQQSLTFSGGTESGETTTSEKDWGFKFKGYFRGPMRLGIGQQRPLLPGPAAIPCPAGRARRQLYPLDVYWRGAGTMAELFFQYGNQGS